MRPPAPRSSGFLPRFLQERRKKLGLSLRDVENQVRAQGQALSFSSLARVEGGIRALTVDDAQALFRVYGLPMSILCDLIDIEELAGEIPEGRSVESYHAHALKYWKDGDTRQALAHLVALRQREASTLEELLERQKSLLSLSVIAGNLGKYRLSHHLVELLLFEPPHQSLVANVLIQAAVNWNELGSPEMALAILERASQHVDRGDDARRAWIAHETAWTLLRTDRLAAAAAALTRALRSYRAAKDRWGECRALGLLVELRLAKSDPRGALEAAQKGLQLARRQRFVRLVLLRELDVGRTLLAVGSSREGLRALRRALARSIEHDDHHARFLAHYHLWSAHRQLDNAEAARVEFQSARQYVSFVEGASREASEIRDLVTRWDRSAH